MIWALAALIFFLLMSAVGFGAPYLPTLKKQQESALDLLDLQPGQTLLELGSGDGRMMRAAARRGIKTVGYELNPLLYILSKITTYRYRSLVQIHLQNYWQAHWPPTDGMYVFLLERYMQKLDTKIVHYAAKSEYKVVSYSFKFPGKKAQKSADGLWLYVYNHD